MAGPYSRWAEVGRGWDAAKGAPLACAPYPAPSHASSTHSPPKSPFPSLGAVPSTQALVRSNGPWFGDGETEVRTERRGFAVELPESEPGTA